MIHQILVIFSNPPAITYFSKSSDSFLPCAFSPHLIAAFGRMSLLHLTQVWNPFFSTVCTKVLGKSCTCTEGVCCVNMRYIREWMLSTRNITGILWWSAFMEHFPSARIFLFNFYISPYEDNYMAHFTDEQTEAQRVRLTKNPYLLSDEARIMWLQDPRVQPLHHAVFSYQDCQTTCHSPNSLLSSDLAISLSHFIESSFSRPTLHHTTIRQGWVPPLIPITTCPDFPPSSILAASALCWLWNQKSWHLCLLSPTRPNKQRQGLHLYGHFTQMAGDLRRWWVCTLTDHLTFHFKLTFL